MLKKDIRFKIDNQVYREQVVCGLAQSGYKVWVEEVKRKDEWGTERSGYDVLVENDEK